MSEGEYMTEMTTKIEWNCAACGHHAALRHRAESTLACVRCARGRGTDAQLAARFDPLLRPLWDNIILLRERPSERANKKSVIIMPPSAFDTKGRPKGAQSARAMVLAMGPGLLKRFTIGSSFYIDERRPMPEIVVGERVMFRDVHEQATTEWRGLSVVHGFDMLVHVDEDESEQQQDKESAVA